MSVRYLTKVCEELGLPRVDPALVPIIVSLSMKRASTPKEMVLRLKGDEGLMALLG